MECRGVVIRNDSAKVNLGSAGVTEGGLSANLSATLVLVTPRSEERRVGKEGGSGGVTGHADIKADNTVTWNAGDAPSTQQISVTAVDDKSVEQQVESFSGLAVGLTTADVTQG